MQTAPMRDAGGGAERTPDGFLRPRDVVDSDAPERELVGMVNDSAMPVHASVWLRQATP